ncbi:MAG TPA: 1-(5-phosphoribosyl)-5-[(5-phosphoribosylamino)methylideneamino] imidazole-4-carboxamide isomerase [Trueperaceae bacterium]|nr:1-(5-phosphoribosyl)-5-[(5-phosphoribosylamino)methylideneamino] imidazole-4-carboxamide isomerase [Trueperaceae bacterium]
MFEVIPCVDVRRGRAVRLYEGDPERETVYHARPLEAAQRFVALGARRLHVVDLDATLEDGENLSEIERLCRGVEASVQVAGGVRSLEAAARRLEFAHAVVLGTVAVTEPEVVERALERFGPERVVVSVDAAGGRVVVRGWKSATDVDAADLARRMEAVGVRRMIFTDTTRDGTLRGVDPAPVAAVRDAFGGTLHAGGGVGSDADLDVYAGLGLQGAIVGRALYEGKITYPRTA